MADENRAEEQATATVQMEEAPASVPLRRRTWLGCGGCVWTLAGGLLLLLFIALLLPAVSPCREAARRMQCCNNLKNIMLAVHAYSTKYGCYPPAYTVDKQGRRMHSWRALLLEFLDSDLYAQYDFSRPWNSPGNLAVAERMGDKGPYLCPTEFEWLNHSKSSSNTSYVMLAGPAAFSDGPTGRKPAEITDKPGETLVVVEMSPSGILWTAPYDLNLGEMSFKINDQDAPGIRSCHPNGAYVTFADGSVRFLCIDIQDIEKFLKAAVTVNGGEDIDISLD